MSHKIKIMVSLLLSSVMIGASFAIITSYHNNSAITNTADVNSQPALVTSAISGNNSNLTNLTSGIQLTAQVSYRITMGDSNDSTTYLVHTIVSYNLSDKNNVTLSSTLTNNGTSRYSHSTFQVRQFESFKNQSSYYNSSKIPDYMSNGVLYATVISHSKDNLIDYVYMSLLHSKTGNLNILTVHKTASSGFSQFFASINYDPTMAYLFAPQFLPASGQGIVSSNAKSTNFVVNSPLAPTPPGGGGGSNFGTSVTGTLPEWDHTVVPGIHLWDATASLAVTWSGQGGSYVSGANDNYYSLDYYYWEYSYPTIITDSYQHSSTSATSSYYIELYAQFPFQGYTYWEAFPNIVVTINNQGNGHVYISNTIKYWNGVTASWDTWSSSVLYNQYVSNNYDEQYTQNIL
ncbi:MAG TPA: hypothetical protein VJ944_04940 [Thermoplasmataceae archaeon]|nr:hypothetical protein [Thermoplasmataceae archaeon]